ncbi:alpha/beta-hydrolase [Ganoderma leucocontextum]|nr:alpha/beta-hydrolase [Ganoderma leucocontextum]
MSDLVSSARTPEPLSLVYKRVADHPINVDIYPPAPSNPHSQDPLASPPRLPAVVYFHGGALTAGNRRSWFPAWLHRWVVSSGIVFISADYRLIPPATGHDILADIKDLVTFLDRDVNKFIIGALGEHAFEIDSHALAVAGSSAGALCAYLAATHASPKPKAVLSLYGMGGDMLTWQYLATKTTPFFRGREMLDPAEFSDFLYPDCQHLQPTSDSPLAYHPPTYRIPGYPSNPRQLLGRLYLQLGTFLDYYTGAHEPGLSSSLRDLLAKDGRLTQHPNIDDTDAEYAAHIPTEHRHLFPQFSVNPNFPPTFLIHGSADTAVFVRESQAIYAQLRVLVCAQSSRSWRGRNITSTTSRKPKKSSGNPEGYLNKP